MGLKAALQPLTGPMHSTLTERLTERQDREITTVVHRERGQLLAYIQRRVRDAQEAEDVLQEAFYELVAAYRLLQPVEQVGAWLMRVARNRIIDRFRKAGPVLLSDVWPVLLGEEPEDQIEDLLPSPEDGPEAELMRSRMLEHVVRALDTLPANQREVFVAHEIEGVSFQALSERLGVSINTLLARKRYAVQRLQKVLQPVYEEWLSGRD